MSHSEQICEKERERLVWTVEQQAILLRSQFDLITFLLGRKGIAVRAKLVLDTMTNAKLATFTQADTNGNPVKFLNPAVFASDNLAAATIDSTQQVLSADGLTITCPVVSIPGSAPAIANITGVEVQSDGTKVAAGDVDNVVAPAVPVATTAKLVLS